MYVMRTLMSLYKGNDMSKKYRTPKKLDNNRIQLWMGVDDKIPNNERFRIIFPDGSVCWTYTYACFVYKNPWVSNACWDSRLHYRKDGMNGSNFTPKGRPSINLMEKYDRKGGRKTIFLGYLS